MLEPVTNLTIASIGGTPGRAIFCVSCVFCGHFNSLPLLELSVTASIGGIGEAAGVQEQFERIGHGFLEEVIGPLAGFPPGFLIILPWNPSDGADFRFPAKNPGGDQTTASGMRSPGEHIDSPRVNPVGLKRAPSGSHGGKGALAFDFSRRRGKDVIGWNSCNQQEFSRLERETPTLGAPILGTKTTHGYDGIIPPMVEFLLGCLHAFDSDPPFNDQDRGRLALRQGKIGFALEPPEQKRCAEQQQKHDPSQESGTPQVAALK